MKVSIFTITIFVMCGIHLLPLTYVYGDNNAESPYEDSESIPVAVEAIVDKEKVSIGDKIKYSLRAETRAEIEIEFPSFGENLAGFAVKDFGEKESGFWGKKKIEKWYILDTYASGSQTIPPTLIKYKEPGDEAWEELESNEVTVEIESILETEGEGTDIRDIKGPVFWKGKTYLFFIIGIVLLLFIIAGVFITRWYKKDEEYRAPRRPAHEIAYEALDKLTAKHLIDQGKVKEYYEELSLIVRYYLENRFSIRAPEMTTEEFLLKVKDERLLPHEHKNALKEFLIHCDMVKFAKYGPSPDEIEKSSSAARRLIDQTKEAESQETEKEDEEDL